MTADYNASDFLFGEDDFWEKMEQVALPLLKSHLQEGYFDSYDGTKIHYSYMVHPKERAAIVISHGFCEFVGKYHEIMYYFFQAGYSVFFIDHRGHGYSQRFVEELDKVYIKTYQEYVGDLKEFMDQVVTYKSQTHKYYLFAHSMGGAIGALFLEQYPDYFSAAILSSPMIQMRLGKVADWQAKLLFVWSVIAGWQYRYVPGQKGFDNVYTFETSSTLSEPRYAYMFRLRQQVPSTNPMEAHMRGQKASLEANKKLRQDAANIKIPVLLFQAGKDTMVFPEPQEQFARESAQTRLVKFPESKHEIFNGTSDIREKYYKEIFAFFEEQHL